MVCRAVAILSVEAGAGRDVGLAADDGLDAGFVARLVEVDRAVMTPWSVSATAGIPSSATRGGSFSSAVAPSRRLYSLCTWRCTNGGVWLLMSPLCARVMVAANGPSASAGTEGSKASVTSGPAVLPARPRMALSGIEAPSRSRYRARRRGRGGSGPASLAAVSSGSGERTAPPGSASAPAPSSPSSSLAASPGSAGSSAPRAGPSTGSASRRLHLSSLTLSARSVSSRWAQTARPDNRPCLTLHGVAGPGDGVVDPLHASEARMIGALAQDREDQFRGLGPASG